MKEPLQCHGILVLDKINLRKSVTVSSKDLTYTGLAEDGPTIDIKNEAAHGLVLLFQPLADKFTQPIGVFVSTNSVKGELAKLVVTAKTLLENSGARIHGVLGDGARTNTKMGEMLEINSSLQNTKTWFTHPLDNARRVFFSPMPDLFKNIHNRLYNKKKLRV